MNERIRPYIKAVAWALLGVSVLSALPVVLYSFVNPPFTLYSMREGTRLGGVKREWTYIEAVPSHLPRALVAAEDANFCLHWGFDLEAIRAVVEAGGTSGASTISQQVASNVFLWRGRGAAHKLLEVPFTLGIEIVWTKRRILEVYLNVVEFGEGVFGASAGAHEYFGLEVGALDEFQSAKLAVVLPEPKSLDAGQLSDALEARAEKIVDGARTIARDGRSKCFEG